MSSIGTTSDGRELTTREVGRLLIELSNRLNKEFPGDFVLPELSGVRVLADQTADLVIEEVIADCVEGAKDAHNFLKWIDAHPEIMEAYEHERFTFEEGERTADGKRQWIAVSHGLRTTAH